VLPPSFLVVQVFNNRDNYTQTWILNQSIGGVHIQNLFNVVKGWLCGRYVQCVQFGCVLYLVNVKGIYKCRRCVQGRVVWVLMLVSMHNNQGKSG